MLKKQILYKLHKKHVIFAHRTIRCFVKKKLPENPIISPFLSLLHDFSEIFQLVLIFFFFYCIMTIFDSFEYHSGYPRSIEFWRILTV